MSTSLISDLRHRIKDVRASHVAISLSAIDDKATRIICEVTTNGRLIITPQGGVLAPVDMSLSSSDFSTINRLAHTLNKMGYNAIVDADADTEHDSVDIEPVGPVDIGSGSSAVKLSIHLFSDLELESILKSATQRHNPSFSPSQVPDSETSFVLTLAQAEVARMQAYDVTKRKGFDTEPSGLLEIARSFEDAYAADTTRLRRALASPKEATPNTMGQGDVVTGLMYKRSLRTGFNAPMGANLPPTAAVLLPPDDVRDVEDDNVKVRWEQNHDYTFYSLELWMDTRPDVVRSREGAALPFSSVPFSDRDVDPQGFGAERPTTSIMVFRSFGANSNFDTAAFATFVEEWGQLISGINVGKLEPESDYYFKLYIIGLNFQATASVVMAYHTKPLRTRFSKNAAQITSSGIPGNTATLKFDNTGAQVGAPLTVTHRFMIGGKEIPIIIVDPFTATYVIPSFFHNEQNKDITIISPTGLIDIRPQFFKVQ